MFISFRKMFHLFQSNFSPLFFHLPVVCLCAMIPRKLSSQTIVAQENQTANWPRSPFLDVTIVLRLDQKTYKSSGSFEDKRYILVSLAFVLSTVQPVGARRNNGLLYRFIGREVFLFSHKNRQKQRPLILQRSYQTAMSLFKLNSIINQKFLSEYRTKWEKQIPSQPGGVEVFLSPMDLLGSIFRSV